MMRCPSCRVDYTGALDRCPLCGDDLQGMPTERVLPESRLAQPRKVASRILVLLTGMVLVLVVMLGIAAATPVPLICIACAALLVNYVFVRSIVVHSPSFLRMVERYYLVLMALALLVLFATGNVSMATFVIPVLSLIALLSNCVLVVVFRNAFVQGYAKYLLYDLALGLVPLVLLAAGLVTWAPLSVASAVVAALLLVLMLCLTRRQLVSELRKLFNA